MHTLRDRMHNKCPACGAEPFKPCITNVPGKKPFVMDTEPAQELGKDDLAWCEFAFFAACHNLKQVSPDHPMVKAVERALLAVPQHNPDQLELFPGK